MSLSAIKRGNPLHPPLVFLHGFLGAKEDFEEMLPFFEERYYCLAYDLPGHGDSPFSSTILNTLAEQLPSSPYSCIGYSLGGRIALQLACRTPLHALAVLSSHTGIQTDQERKERGEANALWVKKLQTLPFEEFLNQWYDQPLFAPLKALPHFHSKILERRKKQRPEHLAQVLSQLSLAHLPAITTFPKRTLFMHGEKDLKYAALYSTLPPHVTTLSIPGCGHALPVENPSLVAKQLLHWMENK